MLPNACRGARGRISPLLSRLLGQAVWRAAVKSCYTFYHFLPFFTTKVIVLHAWKEVKEKNPKISA